MKRCLVGAAVATALGIVGPAALVGSPVGASQPPGNNGTVKVDDVPFDDHPDNEPHVGCVFQIDFYGYDEGDLWATVRFDAQAPTGDELLLEDDDIFIGEDSNAGGGSTAGLDASRSYDLTDELASFDPHPQQGYHVKLTVHADGSQGADTKHKVFWIEGCSHTVAPTSSTSTTVGATTSSTDTTLAAGAVTTTGETVLGAVRERPRVAADVRGGSLPRTGIDIGQVVMLASASAGAGTALVAAARRRRTRLQ